MKKYTIRRSGTIIENATGKIVVMGPADFLRKVVFGECCFVCGAEPGTKLFNSEHVLPNWILKAFKAHNVVMDLPNGMSIKYGAYKVPCCVDCNRELSEKLEVPVSKLLKGGYDALQQVLKKNSDVYHLLFRWMCLIFFKTLPRHVRANPK